jgi:ribonuclease BN (tRNA processing enzyme)
MQGQETIAMTLHFTFLGTGTPAVSLRRGGSAHLVSDGTTRILIDCGTGVTRQLVAAGTRGAAIDALIVTHEHSDHLADFYQLVVSSWHQGRDKPWQIFAPAPALANMQDQYTAYARERDLRIGFEKRPSTTGLEIVFHELVPGSVPCPGNMKITAFPVDHRPVEPAFGLSFSDGAQTLVFSGDTCLTPALEQAAQGCDMLVAEVFVDREMPVIPGMRSAQTVAAVKGYHMTPQDVAGLATRAGVRTLALTHLVPPDADTAALAAEIREAGYFGPLIVGEDLMRLDVAARSIHWNGMTIGL